MDGRTHALRGHATSLRALVGPLLIAPLLAGSSCEPSYPVPDNVAANVGALMGVFRASAVANNAPIAFAATTYGSTTWGLSGPFMVPAYTGDTSMGSAVACVEDLNDRRQVQPVPATAIDGECGRTGTGVMGCVLTDFTGDCDGPVLFHEDLTPVDLLEVGGVVPGSEGRYRRSIVDFSVNLYHEAVHTVQDNEWGGCVTGPEPEAHEHARRFAVWIGNQFAFIRPTPTCVSLDAAVAAGMDPTVRDFMVQIIPGISTSAPLPTAECNSLGVLMMRPSMLATTQANGLQDNRISSRGCPAAAAEGLTLRSRSQDFPFFVSAVPGAGTLYVFSDDGSGPVLQQSIATPLLDINDLTYRRDIAGREYVIAFGRVTAGGAVYAIEDATFGEFPSPPDGLLNGNAFLFTDARLRTITSYAAAGPRPPLLWDLTGQQAAQLLFSSSTGLPSGFGTIAVRVPAGRNGRELWHDPTRGIAIVTGDVRLDDSSRTLLFEDLSSTGIYTWTDAGTIEEIGGAPPRFDSPLLAGRDYVWVRAGIGDTVSIFPVNSAGGQTGSPIGTAVIGTSGRARATLSRALVLGERIRLKDDTAGILGDFPPVVASRATVLGVFPNSGPLSGGTPLWLRGAGFNGTTGVTFDGVAGTALTVVDDHTLRVTTPASADRLAAIRLVSGSSGRVAAGFAYLPGFSSLYRGSALSSWTAGSGWACGSAAIPAAEAPISSDRGGCWYAGVAGTAGALTSPNIVVPGQTGPLTLRVHHRGNFGTDGDGVVLFALIGSTRYPLVPREEATTRVHARNCSGSGATRVCAADPANAGLLGYAAWAAPLGWRTSNFDLPAAFDAGGTFRIELVASNMDALTPGAYALSSAELLRRGSAFATVDHSVWGTLLNVDTSCTGATVVAPFVCATSPVPGGVGAVFRYYNAPLSSSAGQVTWPIALSGLAGRTVTAMVRHRVDMTAGTAVGSGTARVRVCCGATCTTVSPTAGYPAAPPGVSQAFTDEGPDGAFWIQDEFDLSPLAGTTGSCTLMLKGQGAVTATQPGWLVDAITVRWR